MKNSVIKVSIIIPVYNTEQYLRQCLDSVINQTFKDIEVIIINDGSTDGSSLILDEYKKQYSHIKLINQINKGYSQARNVGLEYASGDYIGFVDSDDFIKENMFKKLINKAVDTNADIVSCNYYMFYKKNQREYLIPSNNVSQMEILKKSSFSFIGAEELLLDEAFIWNRIYKRELLVNNNIQFRTDTLFMEDTFFHRSALFCSKKIVYISDILYFYRQGRKGAQTTLKDKRNFSVFVISDKLFELIHKKNLVNILPWMNHLLIYLLCLGYERIDEKYKEEYFEKFHEYLNKYNVDNKNNIPFPKTISYNKTFLLWLRYSMLKFLYQLVIRSVLNNKKFMLDFVIETKVLLRHLFVFCIKLFYMEYK